MLFQDSTNLVCSLWWKSSKKKLLWLMLSILIWHLSPAESLSFCSLVFSNQVPEKAPCPPAGLTVTCDRCSTCCRWAVRWRMTISLLKEEISCWPNLPPSCKRWKICSANQKFFYTLTLRFARLKYQNAVWAAGRMWSREAGTSDKNQLLVSK